jgi:hypothetical protein
VKGASGPPGPARRTGHPAPRPAIPCRARPRTCSPAPPLPIGSSSSNAARAATAAGSSPPTSNACSRTAGSPPGRSGERERPAASGTTRPAGPRPLHSPVRAYGRPPRRLAQTPLTRCGECSRARRSPHGCACFWLPWFDAAPEETTAPWFSASAGACGRRRRFLRRGAHCAAGGGRSARSRG